MNNPPNKSEKEPNITHPLISLLLYNKDYSNVISLTKLFTAISQHNPKILENIELLSRLNFSQSLQFSEFCNKTIIAFPSNLKTDFTSFINYIGNITEVTVNPNTTLLHLLSEAILSTMNNEYNNNTQTVGLKIQNIIDNNYTLLKNHTNRWINTRNFEVLRWYWGDWVILFLFKYCSVFIFDPWALNYIQVLGYSLKEVMSKWFNMPTSDKITNSNSNFYFTKIYNAACNNNVNYTVQSNYGNTQGVNRIPGNNQFIVGRTKIYYCPNFNRKLGFFKKWSIDDSKFTQKTYKELFGNLPELIPVSIKEVIERYLDTVKANVLQFNFPKELFSACPMLPGWKNLKLEIKGLLAEWSNTNANWDPVLKATKTDEWTNLLKVLINAEIPYTNINKFVKSFLIKVLPRGLLGPGNMKTLLKKSNDFISMNRFEMFNRINWFENKEFSFTEMNWLRFTSFSKSKYSKIGIQLKNHIMKTIIHWIFNTLLVQLFRSHFFITEKQGDHFRSFYYHKVLYDLIIKICYTKYIYLVKQYTPVTRDEALKMLKTLDSSPGRLRWMPKPSTMRPITSFKKKTLGVSKTFLKSKLFNTQKIFKFIQNKMQKNTNNCVVFDYKEIMKRLIAIKSRFVKNTSTRPPGIINQFLSYVTMDIEACYDNIDINLLMKFLDQDSTISSTYVTGVLYVLIPKLNKLKNKGETKANADNTGKNSNCNCNCWEFKDCFDIKWWYIVADLKEYIHMLDYIQSREEMMYKNCIVYLDNNIGITYKYKAQFLPTVRDIINNNYIKFNRSFLKQTKGIPQGLSVSSFLCNLFFYEIEKQLAQEIQTEYLDKQSLLLRFMDDYLCWTSSTPEVVRFKTTAISWSKDNKFNFNLKKSQSNITPEATMNETIKFTWNGINFQWSKDNFFNLIYDLKISPDIGDLSDYTKLINVNLPILKNNKDFTWLIKKINSVLFSGHPWIYFLSSITEDGICLENFENWIRFVWFKVIVLIRKITFTCWQPSQNAWIEILDTCIMKMFAFFDMKIMELERKNFFISYCNFHRSCYVLLFKNYIKDDGEYNYKMINYSPLLFKSIKRKIERMKMWSVINASTEVYERCWKDIEEIENGKMELD